ncbi:MAG: DUF1543 domain-containing protein [Pseudomonadota bacterium]
MAKLFIVVVGGYPVGAHTEVHDVRFAIGEGLTDIFPKLKAEWWGGDDRFHFDAWGAMEWVDGHDVVVAETPPADAVHDVKLWFIHLGGYTEGFFGEVHRNAFVVARDQREAKTKALIQGKAEGWDSVHRDTLFSVEDVLNISGLMDSRVHLVPSADEKPFKFEAKYLPKV